MKIKNVCIVGGGSSGWMTAAALVKTCPHLSVTVVESSQIPTVGVGESTLGHFNTYLKMIGLKDEEWMSKCNATYKNSIRFTNFARNDKTSFEYPFVSGYDASFAPDGVQNWGELKSLWPEDFTGNKFAEFFAITNTLLAKHNRETKNEDKKFPAYDFEYDTAYHLDATLFGNYLRDEICIPGGVKVIDAVVHSFNKDRLGNLTEILCTDGTKLYADLWIDCTGFKSILLEGWMGAEFKSFKDYLANDSAWACRVPYTDRKNQMNNVTDCHALNAGWVWNIPLWSRIGTGYCYSSRFITQEEALREFLKHIKTQYPEVNIDELKPFHIDIRHGRRRVAWQNNVVGVGLSYGFIEPLESTGLLSTHENIMKLVDILSRREGYVTKVEQHMFNFACQQQVEGFRDFVAMHYAMSGRTDTPYWLWATQINDYQPELTGDLALALPNLSNSLATPVVFGKYHSDMQGANFIQAGYGVGNINNPARVKTNRGYSPDTPREEINELADMRAYYLKERDFIEQRILELPTHYEFLLKNIYNNNDEFDV